MCSGGIAFVRGKTIGGEVRIIITHKRVAVCFGKYRRGGNRCGQRITFYDRFLRKIRLFQSESVNEKKVSGWAESIDSREHSFLSGLENIDPVNFVCFDLANRIRDTGFFELSR